MCLNSVFMCFFYTKIFVCEAKNHRSLGFLPLGIMTILIEFPWLLLLCIPNSSFTTTSSNQFIPRFDYITVSPGLYSSVSQIPVCRDHYLVCFGCALWSKWSQDLLRSRQVLHKAVNYPLVQVRRVAEEKQLKLVTAEDQKWETLICSLCSCLLFFLHFWLVIMRFIWCDYIKHGIWYTIHVVHTFVGNIRDFVFFNKQ